MREGRISPLINAKRSHSDLEKGVILLVIDPQQLASRKGRCSSANLFREAQMRSYPDAELLRHETIQNRESIRFLGELIPIRKQSEAELNHHGEVRTSHTINQSNSKNFEA